MLRFPVVEGGLGSDPREAEPVDESRSEVDGGPDLNADPLSYFHAEARPQKENTPSTPAGTRSAAAEGQPAIARPADARPPEAQPGGEVSKPTPVEALRFETADHPAPRDHQVPRDHSVPRETASPSFRKPLTALTAFCVLGAIGVAAFYWQSARGNAASASGAGIAVGQASFDSRPAGAEVFLDGILRGVTPLRVSLPIGPHTLEIRSGGASRAVPLTIASGREISQYVEFAATETTVEGRLEITSDPRGAEVRIDGAPRGTTPLSIASIAAGDHAVSISSGGTTVNRSVTVAAGATSTLVVSVTDPASAGGWVSINAPIELQIFEDKLLIGTTGADRLMLTTGRHQLELVNAALEYRAVVPVQVAAGKTTATTVPVPNGSVSINALPWANVFVDGRAMGTTPLGNLSLPIGSHEVVWRHPDLGERRRTVTVTARTPLRIGMEFK